MATVSRIQVSVGFPKPMDFVVEDGSFQLPVTEVLQEFEVSSVVVVLNNVKKVPKNDKDLVEGEGNDNGEDYGEEGVQLNNDGHRRVFLGSEFGFLGH